MNKRLSIILALTMSTILLLSACGKKTETPENTPTNNNTESSTVVEDVTPEVDAPKINIPANPTSDIYYYMPNTEIYLMLPESWKNNYHVIEETQENNDYTTASFYYFGQEADTFGKDKLMATFSVESTEKLVEKYGSDYQNNLPSNITNFGIYEVNKHGKVLTYAVLLTLSEEKDVPVDFKNMLEDARNSGLIYCYVPKLIQPDELARPMVEILENSRSEKENENIIIVSNKEESKLYMDAMNLDVNDIEAFAISTSLTNVKAYNISIIKPIINKGENVRKSLEKYASANLQNFKDSGDAELAIAKSAIVKEVNGYFVFIMCENAKDVFMSIAEELNNLK